MLLAVDIGNTNIRFGLFKGRALLKKASFSTSSIGKTGFLGKLKRAFGRYRVEEAVICSVVPKAERRLKGTLKKIFRVKPIILGKDAKVPIKNLYKKPRQVGQDRLVNAYAGCVLYKAPLVIIDFGTAVTLDVVSKKGAYLGGIIAPGIELALDALAVRTALLPKIRLKETPSVLGRTTSQSMKSGILHGYSAMCDGLVAKLRKRFGLKFNVVATGGNVRLIARYSSSIKKLDEDLTLKGINLVFSHLKKSPK